jgi:hypothetical protein
MPHDLLPGNDEHIIQTNYAKLRNKGLPELDAWRISLRSAKKGKAMNRVAKKVSATPRMKVKVY